MGDALKDLGADPALANPLIPADLVIDHSVQVDAFGTARAFQENALLEFSRNQERYAFLRWGQKAFSNFRVVPPDTGIVHQVNLEYLASVVFSDSSKGILQAYPDTLMGTDSHTTMINGVGVVGWGVGGIEAEACMLGQPISMLLPQVVGFKLSGELPAGATATDLVLTVTQMLRKKGVVGKFVEFFGPGVSALALADRATIANMAPEYGATCGIFPIDAETLRYLRFTNRPAHHELTERDARKLHNGSVVIAAITSCTNTSNPSVMLAAGLLAKKAVEKGLRSKAYVKTSLAPGSKVVTEYYKEAGLVEPLEELGFNLVGYGCTTCIGNSGPLPELVSKQIDENHLVVASVLSGNRNFEGRVHAEVRANFLASPPLVVAYALAGRVDLDLTQDPVGYDPKGEPVYLREIWPSPDEVRAVMRSALQPEMFRRVYAEVF